MNMMHHEYMSELMKTRQHHLYMIAAVLIVLVLVGVEIF
jgi:hypothetical protein